MYYQQNYSVLMLSENYNCKKCGLTISSTCSKCNKVVDVEPEPPATIPPATAPATEKVPATRPPEPAAAAPTPTAAPAPATEPQPAATPKTPKQKKAPAQKKRAAQKPKPKKKNSGFIRTTPKPSGFIRTTSEKKEKGSSFRRVQTE